MTEPLEVVGAVILDEAGKVLCALRSAKMSLAGHWEFPGGKIDADESPEVALEREIEEELGCTISVGDLVADCTYPYPNVTIRLRTYRAAVVSGEPHPAEHEKLGWFEVAELGSLVWAPADLPTIDALTQRPSH
jgi:8-oxo-dGTP diphosphatase